MYSIQKCVYIFTKSPETLFIHQYSVYVEKKYATYTTTFLTQLRSKCVTEKHRSTLEYAMTLKYIPKAFKYIWHYTVHKYLLCRETLLSDGSITTMKERTKHRWRAMQLHVSLKTNVTKINAKVVVFFLFFRLIVPCLFSDACVLNLPSKSQVSTQNLHQISNIRNIRKEYGT